MKVFQQGGQRFIESRQRPAQPVGSAAEDIPLAHPATVHVPGKTRGPALGTLARSKTAPAIDTHKTHPGLHQPARHEQVLPQGMAAVTVAHLRGLLLQVKG